MLKQVKKKAELRIKNLRKQAIKEAKGSDGNFNKVPDITFKEVRIALDAVKQADWDYFCSKADGNNTRLGHLLASAVFSVCHDSTPAPSYHKS